jgi:serine/threonine protein kinase
MSHPLPDVQERERRLDEVIAAYLRALETGTRPNPEQWLAQFPDLADELRDFFTDHAQLDDLFTPLRNPAPRSIPDGSPLPTAPPVHSPLAPAQGQCVGDYELLEEIGRGGMGVVFKARQRSLNRLVALKCLLVGRMALPGELQRFRLETEAIAQLDQPNIVPIYDVGEAGGLPYFTMKLIEGGNLSQQIGTLKEDPRGAARLLATVARAVQHAHQHGILHRDLKPANILLERRTGCQPVQAQGQAGSLSYVPYVSDFGLAKRIAESSSGGDGAITASGTAVGTPSYMAPEQALNARAVTTAADVYSLGAILYELLTGKPPFRKETPLETILDALGREPTPPRASCPALDRDLETICLKCLDKEPVQRYPTAGELADELDRFLAGLPIQARPAGTIERFRRWCRRHPALAGLSAALLFVAVGSFGVVTWLWREASAHSRRAETNFAAAERRRIEADEMAHEAHAAVAEFCIRLSEERLSHVPGLQPLRKEMLQSGLKYYQRFLERRSGDPALRRECADTLFRIAAITSAIGKRADALAEYRKALALYRDIARAEDRSVDVQTAVARTLCQLGNLHSDNGDLTAALRHYEEARELLDALRHAHPDDLEVQNERASVAISIGNVYRSRGQLPEALKWYRQGLELRQKLVDRHPKEPSLQDRLALAALERGHLHGQLLQYGERLKWYRTARDLLEKLAPNDNSPAVYQAHLALALMHLGAAEGMNRQRVTALRTLERSQKILERLVRENPSVLLYQRDLASVHRHTGHIHRNSGRKAEAIASYERSRDLMKQVIALVPDVRDHQNDLAKCLFDLGYMHSQAKQLDQAAQAYEQSRDIRVKLVEGSPESVPYRSDLGMTLFNLGITRWNSRHPQQALEAMSQARIHQSRVVRRSPQEINHRYLLSSIYKALCDFQRQTGRLADAAATARERQQLFPGEPDEMYVTARQLALVAAWVGRSKQKLSPQEQAERRRYADEALGLLRQAVEHGYKNVQQMEKDPALGVLRERPEFAEILADLKERTAAP